MKTGTFDAAGTYPIRSYQEYRNFCYNTEKDKVGEERLSVTISKHINSFGDTEHRVVTKQHRILREGQTKKTTPYGIETDIGLVKKVELWANGQALVNQVCEETSCIIEGDATLPYILDCKQPPIDLTLSYAIQNGAALNKESRAKMTDNPKSAGWDESRFHSKWPTQVLRMIVRFPDICKPLCHKVCVTDEEGNAFLAEERWANQRIEYIEKSNSLYFAIDKPIPSLIYNVTWELPIENPGKMRDIPAVELGRQKIIECLLSLRKLPADSEKSLFVKQCLINLKNELDGIISEKVTNSNNSQNDTFEVKLWAFDNMFLTKEERRWRTVGMSSDRNADIWEFGLRCGNGIVGRAEKVKKTISYIHRLAKNTPETDWYIPMQNCDNTPEIILAIPLKYPFDQIGAEIFAVCCIYSNELSSKLIKIIEELNDSDRKKSSASDSPGAILEIEEKIYYYIQVVLKFFGIDKFRKKNFN